ncbi:protein ECERIFERUM 26-like [Bidens hawaiensis]|uniref:protein ECERIFERUM 26-like n=1 Tax=Bidens hawaiensis TaxID=980011 RepID=UPI00404AAA0F
MVSSEEQNSIYDIKISTVSAGFISGHNAVQELTAMDLAMKLHYLRFVYYFKTPTFDGLTILKIKETMFSWLNHAYIPCGRLRRDESGRAFIKCNDGGVRIIEAKCRLSLDEWLGSKNDSRHKLLAPNQVLGPDLAFSPLVLIQLTDFKCGGKSVGMSWAHVLGDAISAVGFINLWAQVIAGHYPAQPLTKVQQQNHTFDFQNPNPSPDPLSTKRVGPVGDLWSTSNHTKMEPFSFYMSPAELTRLQEQICGEKGDEQIPVFECICVVIWQCLAKVRNGSGPEVVTICRNDLKTRQKGNITNESQTISVVKTCISVGKHSPFELGSLLMNKAVNERLKIEESMGRDDALPDFLIYGANLTFVDLNDASFYEMEVRGNKPVYVNCFIDNIADEGVVLVLPAPKGCSDGRMVSVTLPENQVAELKLVLKEDWRIA